MEQENKKFNLKNIPLIATISAGAIFIVLGIVLFSVFYASTPHYRRYKGNQDVTGLSDYTDDYQNTINPDKYYVISNFTANTDDEAKFEYNLSDIFADNDQIQLEHYAVRLSFYISIDVKGTDANDSSILGTPEFELSIDDEVKEKYVLDNYGYYSLYIMVYRELFEISESNSLLTFKLTKGASLSSSATGLSYDFRNIYLEFLGY